MRQAAFCALALATVLLQVMFVNGLSLPGGSVPDIALVLVVVLALTRGPVTGMLAGFLAGLCLDLAPPGGYLIGGSALVFCVIGYGCGRLGRGADASVPRLLAMAVIAVGAGEAALAAGALIAGDAGITLAAALRGLPAAALYDVFLCVVPLSVRALTSRRSWASQPGRRALRPAGMAGPGAISGSEPLRSLQRAYRTLAYPARAYPARAYPARTHAARAFGGRGYVGRTEPAPATARPARLPARQPAAGSPLRGMLPRHLFRRQPRMCRQVPRWTGARPARHGGTSRPSGGLR